MQFFLFFKTEIKLENQYVHTSFTDNIDIVINKCILSIVLIKHSAMYAQA